MSKDDDRISWLVSCDESGTGGARYYGFGTLWMKYQRRGDFVRDMREIWQAHGYMGECKWGKSNSKRFHEFYKELIDYFFSREWLAFHCLIVNKSIVKKELHGGSFDLAMRKHYTTLITNKVKSCVSAHSTRKHEFRIWVDTLPSSYNKADEAMEIIANRALKQAFGEISLVDSVIEKDSKDAVQIQLCDLLLGAVMESWQQKATSEAKVQIQKYIAEYLGWKDLRSDTKPSERKFNVWFFHDRSRGGREVKTRPVVLKYPLRTR